MGSAYRRGNWSVVIRTLEPVADRIREPGVAFLDNFTDPEPEFRWMVDEARARLEGEER